ncbi:MAG: hypothetical protein IIY88_06180 [Eubacterium sp.]|nr:hypothetical protein [Eubacterium sp.]
MKGTRITILTVLALIASTVFAFADIVDPGKSATSKLVPILIIVVAVIVIALVIRSRRKR